MKGSQTWTASRRLRRRLVPRAGKRNRAQGEGLFRRENRGKGEDTQQDCNGGAGESDERVKQWFFSHGN